MLSGSLSEILVAVGVMVLTCAVELELDWLVVVDELDDTVVLDGRVVLDELAELDELTELDSLLPEEDSEEVGAVAFFWKMGAPGRDLEVSSSWTKPPCPASAAERDVVPGPVGMAVPFWRRCPAEVTRSGMAVLLRNLPLNPAFVAVGRT